MHACVCVLFVIVFAPSYQYLQSTSKVRIFLGSEDILGCPHNLKGLFEGYDVVSMHSIYVCSCVRVCVQQTCSVPQWESVWSTGPYAP